MLVWSAIKADIPAGIQQLRRVHRAFYSPRQFRFTQAASEYVLAHASCTNEICHRVFMPFVNKSPVVGSIVGLLYLGRPSAVARLVVAFAVDSVKRCAAWSFSHISKKIGEYFPPITNCNSHFFVVFVRRARWLSASGKHILPSAVRFGFCAAMPRVPMLREHVPNTYWQIVIAMWTFHLSTLCHNCVHLELTSA